MLAVVAWKYAKPAISGRLRTDFHSVHVNVLRRMLERHLHVPHRLVCITDDTQGLDSRVEALPCPPFPEIDPEDGHYPMCFRRLWNFSDEARIVLGPKILSLDLDVVIVRDMAPIVERDEDFVGWGMSGRAFYQGGIYLHRTGTRRHVWERFDPLTSPAEVARTQYVGSDQRWMTMQLAPDEARFEPGLIEHNRRFHGEPPPACRLVQFSGAGQNCPWSVNNIVLPWVARNWR